MEMSEFAGKIVRKPWGEERLILSTPAAELWHLRIKQGQSSSLHCHPNKKTSFVVLDGHGEVFFMTGAMKIGPMSKFIIRPGLFHGERPTGDSELSLLEVEAPPNKYDIVRLEDRYGREGKPYESEDLWESLDKIGPDCWLDSGLPQTVSNRTLTFKRPAYNYHWCQDDIALGALYVIMDGQLLAGSECVLGPGDFVCDKTLKRLLGAFREENLCFVRVT